jgi:hypothetical protein
MPDDVNGLISKAREAVARKDKRAAQVLLGRVLEQAFKNQQAWELLYSQFGEAQSFEDFRRAYRKKLFPYEAYAEHYQRQEDALNQARRATPGIRAGLAVGYLVSLAFTAMAGQNQLGNTFCLASPGAIAGIFGGYIGIYIGKNWARRI